MAERRMFAKSVILEDDFSALPDSARCLYFYLALMADDDGFLKAVEGAVLMSRTGKEDVEILIREGFLHRFDSGVVVIRHWKLHNYIPKDRYRPTRYQKELAMLTLENKIYSVYTLDTQDRLGKDRLDKISLDKISLDQDNLTPASPRGEDEGGGRTPTVMEILCYIAEHNLQVNAWDFHRYYEENGWVESGRPVRDWRKLLDTWERRNYGTGTP